MLFVHEVHAVIGEREFDFEDAVRDDYAPSVADGTAKLLWYLTSTHGSGDAYHAVTVTAVPDGAAWERLVQRRRNGDLSELETTLDGMRHDSASTLLTGTSWSPLGAPTLDDLPSAAATDGGMRVYREDVLSGAGVAGVLADPALGAARPDAEDVLTCYAAFTPVLSDGDSVWVMYSVADAKTWEPVFANDSGWRDWPGSLTPSLPAGVRSSSRVLRTVAWTAMP